MEKNESMTSEQRHDMIEEIIKTEWDMFQHVNNIGGRASCQDDWETFHIMRTSQYENWTDDLLTTYQEFLQKSEREGRNLVAEKYGRMMKYTEPDYFKEMIEPYVPAVSEEASRTIDEIISIILPWEIEFCRMYPKLGLAGRPVLAAGDASGFTSVETYARGEMETYPEHILKMYLAYMEQLQTEGKSISVMDREVMTRLYGYTSIADAEASIR